MAALPTDDRLLAQGRRLLDSGFAGDALPLLNQAHRSSPESLDCARWLAEALLLQGRDEDAKTALDATIEAVADERPLLCLSPRGRPLTQDAVRVLADGPGAVLIAGRYEGIDERVIEARGLREISIGDYVLSGGELAAMVLLDAVVRLLPGVMCAAESAAEESFSGHLLEYPHYTRPAAWQGRAVPPVLLSGHHEAVAAWRRAQAERATAERRPDLLDTKAPTHGTHARPAIVSAGVTQ